MIKNPNNIDILAKRTDGGVELYIISVGGLDDSPETQTTLMDKIENYLSYIASDDFIKEFGKLPAEKIHIILQTDEPLIPLLTKLFEKIVTWVSNEGAYITTEVKSHAS